MAEQKRRPLRKFIFILILILVIFIVILIVFNLAKPYIGLGVNQTNQSSVIIQQNITNIITNIDQTGQTTFWDTASIAIVSLIVGAVIIAGIVFAYKIMSRYKLRSDKKKKECEQKAIEHLRSKNYDVSSGAKQSYPYYGVDSDQNPVWAFVFFTNIVNPQSNVNTVSKYDLVSCYVDAKTLEVWGESHGKDLNDIKKDLNEQRFGKQGVPNYPGKTEKQPTYADLFAKGSTVNVPLESDEEEEND